MSSGSLPADSGFTLMEMLVALLVISLSMAGLLQAVKMVSRYDHRLIMVQHEASQIKTFREQLMTQLQAREPIIGNIVDGDATSIYYACDAATRTGGRDCHMNAPEGRLSYISAGETLSSWPLNVTTQDRKRRLEAVIWQASSGKTLAVVKLPVEQTNDCQFDMVTRTCRAEVSNQAGSSGG